VQRKSLLGQFGLEQIVCILCWIEFLFNLQSPYWKLKYFSRQFFFRFALCRLHNVLLGHVRKGLEYLAILLGWKWAQGVILFPQFSFYCIWIIFSISIWRVLYFAELLLLWFRIFFLSLPRI
jgi:hypothetical protein